MELAALVERVPEGWTLASYRGRRWGLSRTSRARGRSVAVRAEELGGTGVVSTNVYRASTGDLLRPCEMPAAEVLDFLRGWRPVVELRTDRLVLRDYRCGDARAVHRFASDPETVRFVAWGPNSPADSRAFVGDCLAEQQALPRTRFTLALTEAGGEPFGSVGLHLLGPGRAEVGYVVRRDAWGRGFATEAARAVLEHGFSALGVRRVQATCRPGNVASARVLERIGMTREAYLPRHVLVRGEWQDSLLYVATAPPHST